MPKIEVRKQGKHWAVYCDGQLAEGGFFARAAAQAAADQLAREDAAEQEKARSRAISQHFDGSHIG
jgi:hypothetical protein